MLHKSKTALFGAALLMGTFCAQSQTEVSGFFPSQNELTLAPGYTYKSYSNFYRGDELTEGAPAGAGRISSYIFNLYAEYGFTDWLSANVSLPYIDQQNANEILDPVSGEADASGLQDVNLNVKARAVRAELGDFGKLDLGVAAGYGMPVGDYEGRGIISIGTNATAITGRAIAQLTTSKNYFVELQGGYSLRDNSDYEVPNAMIYGMKLGYFNEFIYFHGQLAYQDSMDGLDIGTPEWVAAGGPAALPQTEVDFLILNVSFYVPILKDLGGISASVNTTLDGRNVSNEDAFSIGMVFKPL